MALYLLSALSSLGRLDEMLVVLGCECTYTVQAGIDGWFVSLMSVTVVRSGSLWIDDPRFPVDVSIPPGVPLCSFLSYVPFPHSAAWLGCWWWWAVSAPILYMLGYVVRFTYIVDRSGLALLLIAFCFCSSLWTCMAPYGRSRL